MSDYLERLTNRLFGLQHDLQPQGRLIFEPDQEGSLFEQTVEGVEEQERAALLPAEPDPSDEKSMWLPHILITQAPLEPEQPPVTAEKEIEIPRLRPIPPLPGPEPAATIPVPQPKPAGTLATGEEVPKAFSSIETSPRRTEPLRSSLLPAQPALPSRQPLSMPGASRFPERATLPAALIPPASERGPESTARVVQVTIGRVEVRLSHTTPPPARPAPKRSEPKVSLSEYLDRRDRGKS